jgi:nucleoside-diphosphate-sugar epimerase
MRVAVTGATGFVGGAIVRRLAAAGHEVLALGRASRGPAGFEYGQWDLGTDAREPPGLGRCEAVVHAAAHVAAWGDERVFGAVTVDGTARLVDAIDAHARLVVIGSSSVYCPDGRGGTYREQDGPVEATRYRGAYPRAKAAQERLLAERRPDAIVLRPRAVWGPGDRTLLPRLEARIRAGRLVLPDGGRHPMSTTHVESLLDAVEAALRHPAVAGPVNVADATPHSAAELLEALFVAQGRKVRIVSIPGRVANGMARAVEAGWRIARIQREPPFTHYAVDQLTAPIVLDLTRLARDLGITPDADVRQRAGELAVAPA